MTERLYYTDAYLTAFDATVVSSSIDEAGRRLVVLDRTAFYPTSGGQPFDTGRLSGTQVIAVEDTDHGDVVHVVQGEALAVGSTVRGDVDWPRRFDHMQQHTGQHVLSAAFDRLCGARTVSFHLGTETSTIDLSREVSGAELETAEDEANRVVWDDRPVAVRFASAEDAAALPLRKEPQRTGLLRLVDIDGFDLSACGGTHVARAGGIGLIAIASSERFKGGERVEFVCGHRALRRFRSIRESLGATTRLLSVGAHEVAPAVERMLADAREHRRALALLNNDLARYRADELAAAAEPSHVGRLIVRALDADAPTLKAIAAAMTSRAGLFAVLLSNSSPALVVVARSADVSASANEVLSALIKQFGGRGGGKPDLAQGGGLNAPVETIVAAAREIVDASERRGG